jgi:transaldolase
MAPNERLAALSAAGVSIWLDDLSRERLTSGNLQELITDKSVVGVTTNPTIFAAALANGQAYDAQVRELAARGASVDDTVREVTVGDVQQACDVFSGTVGAQRRCRRPGLARGQPAARPRHRGHPGRGAGPVEGRGPAQPAGQDPGHPGGPAGDHPRAGRGGQHQRHADLLRRALPRRDDRLHGGPGAGRRERADAGGIASVASFFVSRVDTEIDKRLEKIGTDEALALRGKAGVANSRLAYAAFEEVFQGKRWAALTAQGAKPQRPLWASTGVKNPDYSDTMYVTELVVADTVNTMPEKTLLAFADHGEVEGDQVTGTAAQAQEVFDALERVGVDLTDVFLTVEDEGVQKFEASWQELLDTVKGQLDAAK